MRPNASSTFQGVQPIDMCVHATQTHRNMRDSCCTTSMTSWWCCSTCGGRMQTGSARMRDRQQQSTGQAGPYASAAGPSTLAKPRACTVEAPTACAPHPPPAPLLHHSPCRQLLQGAKLG